MTLPEDIKQQVKDEFASLSRKVILKVFTQSHDCQYCDDTTNLVKGVAQLSDFIAVEIYDFEKDQALAQKYKVEMVPAILLHNVDKEWPIRFYGIPAGYEFSALIEAIKYVGTGNTGLSEEILKQVQQIKTPTDLKVFVTTSCPYCSSSVLMAFQLAMANPEFINANMIEAAEFPQISTQFSVRAVPKTVVNDKNSFEGSLPPEKFFQKVLQG